MKKAHLLLIMSTLLAGCGKDINGTYTGTETYSNMSLAGQNQSSPVTITVSNDESVTWVGQYGSGSGKLKKSGDESMTGTMSITDASMMGGFGGPMGGTTGSATNYMMTITFSGDNQLTATGMSMGQQQQQQGQLFPGMMNQGGGSRNATAKKAGNN
jgi:hypothetical protein